MTSAEWDTLARDWLAEIRAGEVTPAADDTDAFDEPSPGSIVTLMNFSARPEEQWAFIQATMARATTDGEWVAIAAGPVEHLLGWHGPDYIERVEHWAASDPRVARMLTGVWRYLMNEDTWACLQAIGARVGNPLSSYRDAESSGQFEPPAA